MDGRHVRTTSECPDGVCGTGESAHLERGRVDQVSASAQVRDFRPKPAMEAASDLHERGSEAASDPFRARYVPDGFASVEVLGGLGGSASGGPAKVQKILARCGTSGSS